MAEAQLAAVAVTRDSKLAIVVDVGLSAIFSNLLNPPGSFCAPLYLTHML